MLAAVALAVVLLASLWALGVGPFARTAPSRGAMTYSRALSLVEADEGSYAGTSWSPVAAAGAAPVVGTNLSLSAERSALSVLNLSEYRCSFATVSGAPQAIPIPGNSHEAQNGSFDLWVFVLRNSSNGLLFVLEVDGAVYPFETLSGGDCSTVAGLLSALPTGSGVVDSSVAAAAALAHGGSRFFLEHPESNVTMSIDGGISFGLESSPATWEYVASVCPIGLAVSSGVEAPTFTARLDASNGTWTNSTNGTTACRSATGLTNLTGIGLGGGGGRPPSTTPLRTVFALGAFAESGSGSSFYYNTTVGSTGPNLTWSEIHFLVETATGVGLSNMTSVTVEAAGGACPLASYGFVSGLWSVPTTPCTTGALGGAAPVTVGATVDLLMNANIRGDGDSLVAVGEGNYTGSVTFVIP